MIEDVDGWKGNVRRRSWIFCSGKISRDSGRENDGEFWMMIAVKGFHPFVSLRLNTDEKCSCERR